jgi:hypothetical protein
MGGLETRGVLFTEPGTLFGEASLEGRLMSSLWPSRISGGYVHSRIVHTGLQLRKEVWTRDTNLGVI